MDLALYQIDAFTDRVFSGNPAAVCILADEWLPINTMQAIAQENNLAETAFVITKNNEYSIRWFTPTVEVDLCGHATLASAYVLWNEKGVQAPELVFHSNSGELRVTREDGQDQASLSSGNKNEWIVLDFPLDEPQPCEAPPALLKAFDVKPMATLKASDYLVVFENQQDVVNAQPDKLCLQQLDGRGVIITAPASEAGVDFVSRFFAPNCGIDEDPVTGSAHTELTPYWAKHFDKHVLVAKQVSARGGFLKCELQGDRVIIKGQAVKYLQGAIHIH